MSELPEGWVRGSLDDVGRVHCGQSPSRSEVNDTGEGVPYVSGPEQWDGLQLHLGKWTTTPKRMAPDRSIFVTVKGAGVGTIFPGQACAIGRDVYAFEPEDQIDERFVEHALRFTVSKILRNARGDIPGLSKSHLLDHRIGIPPTPEQRRIVAKIEELFSELDAGNQSLERAQVKLERYRASVLKAAVEGHLTEQWRRENPSDETGQELLERILVERRKWWEEEQLAKYEAKGRKAPKNWRDRYKDPVGPDRQQLPELPEAWCWATATEVGTVQTGTTPSTKNPAFYNGDLPFFKPTDLDQDYSVTDARQHLSRLGAEKARCLGPWSVMVTCIGATIGKTGLARVPCATNQQINAIDVGGDELLGKYLYLFFSSPRGQEQVIQNASSTTMPILNKRRFSELTIPLPPRSEQRKIVETFEQLEADRVTTVAEGLHAQARCTRLRQSILKRAFEGRLVPQSPNDEPASVLLARIRVEREAEKPKTKDCPTKKSPSRPKADS